VKVVYDSVGKDTWEGSLASLRRFGLLVSFGNASGPVAPFAPAVLAADAGAHGRVEQGGQRIQRGAGACDQHAAIRRGAAAALRLGAIPAAALAILSPLLARFYAEHPEVHVDVHEDASTRLLSQLLGGGLDAVFCREPALLPGPFVFQPLLADTAVVVAARSHALAGRRDVPLQALAGARWVLPTANIAVRGIFEAEVLKALPDAPWFPVSTVSLPSLEGLLSQPGAVALVPLSIAPGLQTHARVCRLDVRLQGRLAPLGVVHRRDHAPALLSEMLRLCLQMLPPPPAR
jgi:DNA-binding transcriptional LysR family regulator